MAYDTATITRNEALPDGRAQLTVAFTGPGGEPTVTRDVYIDAGTTTLSLKRWAIGIIDGLNSARTVMQLPALQVGQVIDVSAIVIPPSVSGFYVASALAMPKAASKNYLSVFNADPALIVQVVAVKINQELTAAVTGLARGYRLFAITSHSAGTPVTPAKTDNNWSALSANITSRSNGLTAAVFGSPLGIDALAEEETGTAGSSAWLYRESDAGAPLVLRQNQGVVIQQDATAGTGLLSAVIYFRVD